MCGCGTREDASEELPTLHGGFPTAKLGQGWAVANGPPRNSHKESYNTHMCDPSYHHESLSRYLYYLAHPGEMGKTNTTYLVVTMECKWNLHKPLK